MLAQNLFSIQFVAAESFSWVAALASADLNQLRAAAAAAVGINSTSHVGFKQQI